VDPDSLNKDQDLAFQVNPDPDPGFLKNDVIVPSKSNKQENFFLNLFFVARLEGQW
jgi:hypothetical protein